MRAQILLMGVMLAGCGSNGATDSDGGAGDLAAGSFQASGCGSCVEGACATAIASCGGDTGCAAWYACVRACPTGANGDADASCEGACPAPPSSTGAGLRQSVIDCRTRGPGAAQCPDCGHAAPDDAGTSQNPILNQQCPAPTDTAACPKCEDVHCCMTYDGCHNDPACQALANCEKACDSMPPDAGTDSCIAGCEASAPKQAVQEYATRLACIFVECLADCAGAVDPCIECGTTACVDSFLACQTDADCYLITRCSARCATGDEQCIDGCVSMYPAGRDKFNTYTVCVLGRCQNECG